MMPHKMKNLPSNGKPQIKKETLKRLLSYVIKPYKLQGIVVLVCILISAIVGVLGSMFLKTLVDDYITPLLLENSPVFNGLIKAVLTMAGIYLLGVLVTFFYNRIMVVIAQGVLKTVRDDMFTHMQSLPIGYFDTNSNGDIMSRYTNDTDTLRQMISQSIPQVLASGITVIAVLCAMISISIWLTILVLSTVFIMLFVTRIIAGKSAKYFIKQQEMLGKLNGYIEEMIQGQKVIKVFCHEEKAKSEFKNKNEELFIYANKANRYANIMMPIMGNIGNLQYVLIAIVGGAMAINGIGGITLGAIASFLSLSKSFNMPISQISQQINSVVMALAGSERIFNLLDEKSEEDKGQVTLVNAKCMGDKITETEEYTGVWAWKEPEKDGNIKYTRLMGDVRFYDVDFGYSEDKIVLHDIDLYAKPGHKIAFVGATGAGKTTITNLINRFYDLADGKIRYDGININKIKKGDLRRSLGIVLQDTNLFTGTIKENIRYGKLNATDQEVYDAAKLANADSFIKRLPDGYDTMISADGGQLSQGQKQLISIARAAILNPPVMILDEATSSIDTRTEAIVQKGMDRLMNGRTVFVIAHRLSTVQNSNVIMVLEHGRIIERGDHDDLVAQKGKYYQLYTGAFELE